MFNMVKEVKRKFINCETKEEIDLKEGDIVNITYIEQGIYIFKFLNNVEIVKVTGRVDYICEQYIKLDMSEKYNSKFRDIHIGDITNIVVLEKCGDYNE